MNAYELADRLTTPRSSGEEAMLVINHAIPMLRQQADRIAELEKQGKPVAWIRSGDDQLSLVKEKNDGYMVWKPLYLSPQTKPLSNEEIWDIWNKNGIEVPYEFAKAIEERHGIK
jgi:hypothetical protein